MAVAPQYFPEEVVFDFEDDPVFIQQRLKDEKEAEKKRNDRRFKTVVCRHWVKGLCMKLDNCEFLHELDNDRMPECRWGEKCQVPDCYFKHTKESDRQECAYYTLGFCAHGTSCRYRHIRKAKEELQEETNWDIIFTTAVPMSSDAAAGAADRRVQEPNVNFKISLCKHFVAGTTCPYGDKCHFAHGENELRDPSQNKTLPNLDNAQQPHVLSALPVKSPLEEAIDALTSAHDTIPDPLADVGQDLRTPDIGVQVAKYIVLRAETFAHLAASVKHNVWAVHPVVKDRLNHAFYNAERVIIIFTVDETRQFAGCAIMKSDVKEVMNEDRIATPEEAKGLGFMFEVDWVRSCVVSYSKTSKLSTFEPELNKEIPVAFCFEGTELPPQVGHSLLVMLFRESNIDINRDQIDASLKVSVHPPGPSRDLIPILDRTREIDMRRMATNTGSERHNNIDEKQLINPPHGDGPVPVAPGCMKAQKPGFIFAGDDFKLIDEMLGRLLFGVEEQNGRLLRGIEAGTIIFLLNLRNGQLFGVFEALDVPQMNLDPKAFATPGTRRPQSQLPLQLPVNVLMELKPISAAQVATHTIPRGPEAAFKTLSMNQTQQLINLLFIRSGLLDNSQNQMMLGNPNGNDRGGHPAGYDDDARINFSSNYSEGINEEPLQEPTQPGQPYTQKLIVNIPFKPGYKAANRMIGRGGTRLRAVQQATGVSCRIRNESDDPDVKEIVGPIHVILQSTDASKMRMAIDMMKDNINEVIQQHDSYVKKGEELRQRRLERQHR